MQVKPPHDDTPAGARQRAVLGQLSDIDLRLLRVFRSVVECGGMAAAELELNIDISTISRHIKDLETRLRLVLCQRGRAGFALTREGQRVYEDTLRLLASVDAFRSGIDDIHRRISGQLTLALFDKTATNPRSQVAEAMARFAQLAPEVELNVHIGSISAIEQGVLDGRYHVGIIPAHRASRQLAYDTLFDERMQLYCGAQHPLFDDADRRRTWEEIRGYAFAGLGYHSPNMQLTHRARLTRAATGFDQEAIAVLILSGRYLGFLPDHYAQIFEARGQMRPIYPSRFHYACQFVSLVRRSPSPSRATAAFVTCLQAAHGTQESEQTRS